MDKPRFKPGDRVRCIASLSATLDYALQEGVTYCIRSYDAFTDMVTLDDGSEWFALRFELAEAHIVLKMLKLYEV